MNRREEDPCLGGADILVRRRQIIKISVIVEKHTKFVACGKSHGKKEWRGKED